MTTNPTEPTIADIPHEDAGQTEDLVARLRGLIRDYPAGIGILKEFLQNADDAGASWVRFTLDLREHGRETMLDARMGPLFGPSLLVESDQSFTPADIENIQRIGNAGKVRDGGKTGRFGLGFNTAYNLTDYPAFATNDRIICFDPHRDAIAGEQGRPGRSWRLQDLWEKAPGWPAAFGIETGTAVLRRRTIFRLPLRTGSQATESRVASHSFPPENVLTIFEELGLWGGALSIFLRSVLHVHADVIHADGRRESLVSITTANAAEVAEVRARIAAARNGTMDELLARWSNSVSEDVGEVYPHRFSIETASGTRSESWRVCQGLFFGDGSEVIDAARSMRAIDEKAIPLAGAAVLVEEMGDCIRPMITKGRLYCSLPLPDAVPLAFLVNAFFDLDSSRSQITHGAQIGDAALRVEWNGVLMEHVVPAAIGTLFEHIAETVDAGEVAAFYGLWPDLGTLAGPLLELGRHVYGELAVRPLFQVHEEGVASWVAAGEVTLPATAWSAKLRKTLLADGLALPHPSVPPPVVGGLTTVDEGLARWTPDDLRQWLQMTTDPACDLADAPRLCLRDRGLVLELLAWCSEGGAADVTGLPLAVMADGKLRAFNLAPVWVADPAVRSIFCTRSHWFVASDADQLVRSYVGKLQVADMDVASTIKHLTTYVPTGTEPLTWAPGGAALPNAAWLSHLYQWLAQVSDLEKHIGGLQLLPIIPDHANKLHRPGYMTTPLLPDDGVSHEVREALRAFGVPIVAGTDGVITGLRALSSRCSALVWGLTGRDVVDTMATVASPGAAVPSRSPVRATLLNWLAEQDSVTPLAADRLDKLAQVSLWPTRDGRTVPARSPGVFLPTNFRPPPFFGEAALLESGVNDAWRSLLVRLGAEQLDLATYMTKFFLPGYAGLSEKDRTLALKWLRNHGWQEIVALPLSARLQESVKQASLVRGADGAWHRANELYHPDADAHELLGDIANTPDVRTYADDLETWLALFNKLGLCRPPQPGHILARVDKLLADVEPLRSERGIHAIVQFLEKGWAKMDPATRAALTPELKKRAWLPVLQHSDKVAGLATPSSRFLPPAAVYPQRLQHLVASQAAVLAFPGELPKELREALGMPSEVPLDMALAHFGAVRELWDEEDHGGLTGSGVRMASFEVLRLLATRLRAPAGSPERLAANRAVAGLAEVPCIWDAKRQRFWLAKHTFDEAVPFFGEFRVQFHMEETDLNVVASELGRRVRPDANDHASFLVDVHSSVGDAKLDPRVLSMVAHAWQQLGLDPCEIDDVETLPVLTATGHLRALSSVLVDDAPWWRDRLNEQELPWVDPRVAASAAAFGACSAACEVREEVLSRSSHAPPDVIRRCSDRQSHIESVQFLEGIERLVRRLHGADIDIEAARSRLVVGLHACGSLRTGLSCTAFGVTEPIGPMAVACLLVDDTDVAEIYVATSDIDTLVPALADALNRRLGSLKLANLAPLEDILRGAASEVHSKLDNRKVPRLLTTTVEGGDWGPGQGVDESFQDESADDFIEPGSDSTEEAGASSGPAPRSEPAPATTRTASPPPSSPGPTPATRTDVPAAAEPRPGTSRSNGVGEPAAGAGPGLPRDPSAPPLFGRVPTNSSGSSASADHPPTTPHLGQGGRARNRPAARLRTYVQGPAGERERTPEALAAMKLTEDGAVLAVVTAERGRGCEVEIMPPGNPGFDLRVTDPAEHYTRIVEVKGLGAGWDLRGVGLTPREMRTAIETGDAYWLYVVENARDPRAALISRVQDPAGEATEFRFDDGWRGLAQEPAERPLPEPGRRLCTVDGAPIGVIAKATPRGVLTWLEVTCPDGEIRNFAFNASEHIVLLGEA